MKVHSDKSIKPASLSERCMHVEIKAGEHGIKSIAFKENPVENAVENPLVFEAEKQIRAYLTGKRKTLDFPIEIKGTDFQVAVYEGIREIPYGTVWTYKEVAVAIGRPNAQRAVGGALNKNPLSLIVPCHRVIGANGKLVGFGSGLPLKKALLKLEGAI